MVVPVVVVQGLPPSPDWRSVVLSACSDALKYRSCVSADDQDRAAPSPSATAIIAWPEGTDRHVHVTLERYDGPSRRIDRDTRFADEDPAVERWRTVGLVIAALVGESDARESAAPDDRSWLGPSARSGAHAAAWLGLSGLVGPGLDDGSVRLGADAHGAIGLRRQPFYVLSSVSHALRPRDDLGLEVRWTTLAVGAGARASVPSIDLGLRARFEIMLEYLLASSASGGAVSGGGSRLSPGIRAGGDLLWPASGALGATLGFSMWSLPGGTAIQVDQRKLGSSQWLSYAAFLGAEWSFR
jgi:hypothetical protein